jgi:LemA protein
MSNTLIWTLAIAAILILYIIATYNGLISARNQTREAWGTVDTQLKRRYDLIPNLVETVKGYATHEKETLTNVIAARDHAMAEKGGAASHQKSENELSATLKSLFAVAEDYPDLKADKNFLELQQELSDTENKIQATRQFYNSCVLSLNDRVGQFPSNIIANLFKIKEEKYFELSEDEKVAATKPVNVKF